MFYVVRSENVVLAICELSELPDFFMVGSEVEVATFATRDKAVQSLSFDEAHELDLITNHAIEAHDALYKVLGADGVGVEPLVHALKELERVWPWLATNHER